MLFSKKSAIRDASCASPILPCDSSPQMLPPREWPPPPHVSDTATVPPMSVPSIVANFHHS